MVCLVKKGVVVEGEKYAREGHWYRPKARDGCGLLRKVVNNLLIMTYTYRLGMWVD